MSYINYYIINANDNLIVWKGFMGGIFVIFFALLAIIILRKRTINRMDMMKFNHDASNDMLFNINCSLHDESTIRRTGRTSIYSEKDIDDAFYYINIGSITGAFRIIGDSVRIKVSYKNAVNSKIKESTLHNNYMLRDELLDDDQMLRIQLAEINVEEEIVIDYSIKFDYVDEYEKINYCEYKFSNYF